MDSYLIAGLALIALNVPGYFWHRRGAGMRRAFAPSWWTYKVEKRARGLRKYRARSTYVAVGGVATARHYAFTRRGAERWIERLRAQQVGEWRAV